MCCIGQVRANSLQELVYKQGQAGVTKASVSIVFNNSDKANSPVSYENFDRIAVTRQVCSAWGHITTGQKSDLAYCAPIQL